MKELDVLRLSFVKERFCEQCPNFFVVPFKLIEFLCHLSHNFLIKSDLLVPFFHYDRFEKSTQLSPKMVSVKLKVLIESLCKIKNFIDMQLIHILFKSLFPELDSLKRPSACKVISPETSNTMASRYLLVD